MFFRKKNRYGEYSCNDYLNSALRFLLENEEPFDTSVLNAIAEICYCIKKADGVFADDVREKLNEIDRELPFIDL